jgi:ABC-type branched-subunit amino acid transport system ATPase component
MSKATDRAAAEASSVEFSDSLLEQRDAARIAGKRAMGITGESGPTVPLREVLRTGGGVYPISALGVLTIVDVFQGSAYSVLGPDIARTLGLSRGTVAGLVALRILAVFVATLPAAALTQRVPRRAMISVASGFAWVLTAFMLGIARSAVFLGIWLIIGGLANGASQALHRPLVVDLYPPSGRLRMLSVYRIFDQSGNLLAPLLIAFLTTVTDLTWRGVFMVICAITVPAALYSLRLRDPGFGKYDDEAVRQAVVNEPGSTNLTTDEVQLGFFEIVRRLFMIGTVRRILVGWAVLGLSFVPLSAYLSFFLLDRWGMQAGARAIFSGCLPILAITMLSLTARRGDELLRKEPAELLRRASVFIGGGALCVAAMPLVPGDDWRSPNVVLLGLVFGLGLALQTLGFPLLEASQFAIIPANMRPHASALAGIFLSAVGGLGGVFIFGSIDRRFGVAGVFVPVGILGIVAGVVLRSAARLIDDDLNRTVDTIAETEQIKAAIKRGEQLPLLTARGIDFSYGTVPVLFDVNFSVGDGEMVALLGTNGAGKSTLLRVVSGLGLPQTGTVRFRGQDITYLDAERRVGMGITQIPGGKAAFGPLTVVENLRVAGFTHGRNKAAVDAGIEASFAAFPRLAERRNQLAGTLSGGEQQMLALSKALILKPRLLLIDELSLGLAPKIVGELLEMVRQINSTGTAVVLVEQSVNVALSLVNHAYFMEKGEIRFDGKAADLLGRTDLLRSVFLEGAGSTDSKTADSGVSPLGVSK